MHDSIAPLAFSLPPTALEEHTRAEHEASAYLRLARAVLDAQRNALLEEKVIGQYSSESLRAAEAALDAHELRLTPPAQH